MAFPKQNRKHTSRFSGIWHVWKITAPSHSLFGGFHGDSVVLGQWVQFPLSASRFLSVFPLPHSMDRKLTPAVPLVRLAMWERLPNAPLSPPITSQNSGSCLVNQPITDSLWLSPGMTIVFSHNRPDTKWQQRNSEWREKDGAPA